MTSLAPSDARWSAVARPIPREAPVTIATRPWRGRDEADCESVVAAAMSKMRYLTSNSLIRMVRWSVNVRWKIKELLVAEVYAGTLTDI